MWVAAVKSDFYVFRKLGAWRPKNRQNPVFPVCSHAVRHTLRCRNLKFGMYVSFVCGLLPLRVIFMYFENGALCAPKTRFFLSVRTLYATPFGVRNLKFDMYVPFVRWLLPLRVIFKYFENGALCAPKTHFSCLFTRCTRHPSIYPRMLRIVPILAFTFLKLLI